MQCDKKKTKVIKNIKINNCNITQSIKKCIAKAFLGKHKEIYGQTKIKAYERMAGQVLQVQRVRQTKAFAT